ncbi:MAG: hypothetical protein CFH10_00739, partial [Alphaproteobacteria bacterium MarineAlpha4_Bin2]
ARGQDLVHVAEILRIHRSYLQAIEEGEIERLPGPTYAVGFVRTYADYLGLDGNNVAERFKDEGKVTERRGQLIFPSPLPEGQVPSLAVVLIAALLLLVAYGGWVFISSTESGSDERVPLLSDRVASAVKRDRHDDLPLKSKEISLPGAQAVTGSSIEIPTRINNGAPLVVPAGTEDLPPKVAVERTPGEAENTLFNTVKENGAPKIGPTIGSPTTAKGKKTARKATFIAGTAKIKPKVPSSAKVAEEVSILAANTVRPNKEIVPSGDKLARNESPKSALEVSEDNKPQVYGDAALGSRITILALIDSWVEVRNREGELLLTRVLQEGDRYHVPDRSGLTLLTGNAGGLELAVDSVKVPKIGPLGAIRRNVRLEPKALRDGTAHTR